MDARIKGFTELKADELMSGNGGGKVDTIIRCVRVAAEIVGIAAMFDAAAKTVKSWFN